MMQMSKGFAARWQDERLVELLPIIILQPRLRALVEAPFIRKAGGLLLEPLNLHTSGPECFPDATGYEAFINKIHVDDYMEEPDEADKDRLSVLIQQGAKAAVRLSERLETKGPYRIVLSLDLPSVDEGQPTMDLRFFERRIGEPWLDEDLDAYQLNELLLIDTNA